MNKNNLENVQENRTKKAVCKKCLNWIECKHTDNNIACIDFIYCKDTEKEHFSKALDKLMWG